MRLGIDFGTTRTVVAACDRGNYPTIGFTTGAGVPVDWYPSLVAERHGELRFGLDAQACLHDPEWTVVRSFKRLLAHGKASPQTEIELGTTRLTLIDLLSGFFAALQRDLWERSNLPLPIRADDALEVVVATPANAHNTQRFVTLDGFRRAGFEVVSILNEPSAAGLEYAHRYRRTITSKRESVLVYDLGGGTFDASLVKMRGHAHDVIASAGINRLGGDDFDQVLLDLTLDRAEIPRGELSAHTVDRLLEHCREQKERLHPNSRKVVIELGAALTSAERDTYEVVEEDAISLNAGDYYDRCTPLVERSLEVTSRVAAAAGGDLDGVAGLYVVGGASSLPVVARTLRDHYGHRVHRSAYPSAATAIGLAIAADEQTDFSITERMARNFGVFREAEDGTEVAFDPLFSSGMALPEPGRSPVVLTRTYRAKHNIGHFRFIECGWVEPDGTPGGDITPFADVMFPFAPELRERIDLADVQVERFSGDGPLIEERYAVDDAGIAELTIADLDSGYQRHHRLGG